MAIIHYSAYVRELEKYFTRIPKLMTEDLVRYIFMETHSQNCDIEIPYIRTQSPATPLKINGMNLSYFQNSLSRADLYYEKGINGITNDGYDAVIEFKFHRCTRYSQNCTTSKIGSVFSDLNRLSTLTNGTKYIIYVFDKNMLNYFKGSNAGSPRSYFNVNSLSVGKSYTIAPDAVKTPDFFGREFSRNALHGFDKTVVKDMSSFCYNIELEHCAQIPNVDYYLVAYKVNNMVKNSH